MICQKTPITIRRSSSHSRRRSTPHFRSGANPLDSAARYCALDVLDFQVVFMLRCMVFQRNIFLTSTLLSLFL
jgi:hypothetical protein